MTIDMTAVCKHLIESLSSCVATKVLKICNDCTSCVATGTIGTVKFTITLTVVRIDVLEDKSIQEDLQVSITTELDNHYNFYVTHIITQNNLMSEVNIVSKVFNTLTNSVNFICKQM